MSNACIEIRGLSKNYGGNTALSNLEFDVHAGEIFGFLGANGAGKTTTIRILLDIIRPSAGSAKIFGSDCQHASRQTRRQVGYLPGDLTFYGEITGRHLLDFLATLESRPVDPTYQEQLLSRLGLDPADLNRKIREYSTGMRRKLGIVQALQSDPPLLILDEPTEGLDPLVRDTFHQILLELKANGRTIFFSSHVLSEVDRICERIAVVRGGELVLLSDPGKLRQMQWRIIKVTFSSPVQEPAQIPAGTEWINHSETCWNLKVQGPLALLLKFLSQYPVQDLHVEEPKLEDILLRYYEWFGVRPSASPSGR